MNVFRTSQRLGHFTIPIVAADLQSREPIQLKTQHNEQIDVQCYKY